MNYRDNATVLFGATLGLVTLLLAGMSVAQVGGVAYGLGYIDASTAAALGLTTGGGATILTGLSTAGTITASTAGAGLVVLGGATL